MSYVYYSSKKGIEEPLIVFTVGHYNSNNGFIVESVWDTKLEAAAQVSYLNGGSHPNKSLEYDF